MPAPSELIDERFDELVTELRSASPTASDELRARVALTTMTAPPRRRFEPRRVLPLVAAASVAAAALVAAGVALDSRNGDVVAGGGGEEAQAVQTLAQLTPAQKGAPRAELRRRSAADDDTYSEAAGAAPATANAAEAAPTGGTVPQRLPGAAFRPSRRLQDYRTYLRVHVGDSVDLSRATARAMRATRSLGGFVVSARYDTPVRGEGDSVLVVRVPIGRVQEAIARFSALGTIVSQRIQIDDLQQQVNRRAKSIDSLRATIDVLEEQLDGPGLTEEARARLQLRLAAARDELAAARRAQRQTIARGRLARVSLTLTTREAAELVPPKPPGELEQTLRDAVGAAAQIFVWLLAGLIIVAPFLVLAGATFILGRKLRRQAAERLLESS